MSKRRYLCTGCRQERRLFDYDAPATLKTGCPTCEKVRRWVAYGSDAFVVSAQAAMRRRAW